MTYLELIVADIIFILFPLFSYFLFLIYRKNIGKEVDEIVFDLAIYTSVYLILSYSDSLINVQVAFISIPLLIAYLSKKKEALFIISSVIVLYYLSIKLNIFLILFEFISFFVAHVFLKKKNKNNFYIINVFAIIKILSLLLIFIIASGEITENLSTLFHRFSLLIILYASIHFVYILLKGCEDISSLHITVKQLEKEKQLRDSLFKITHEIKNPIAVCKGYLDMLNLDDEKCVQKYIPIIKQEIDRTIILMNDFLNLTKITVDRTKMDVTVLLEDVCELVQILINSHNITFEYYIIDSSAYILGDYDRLKQVLINIIKNAIEAIEKGKEGHITLKANDELKQLEIFITDDGIGMNKATLSKIGEPFYTTKQGGTGLGVRFSKEIIKAHKGTIVYNSKKGKGTTVVVTLPLIKKSF